MFPISSSLPKVLLIFRWLVVSVDVAAQPQKLGVGVVEELQAGDAVGVGVVGGFVHFAHLGVHGAGEQEQDGDRGGDEYRQALRD